MLITKKEDSRLKDLAKFLPKLSNYLIGLALICYLSGFVITNLYLGSLGVVSLDLLRTRYVLVGFLFLLFVGAISYLVYGLVHLLRQNTRGDPLDILWKITKYSLKNLGFLFFPVAALSVLAGSTSRIPVGLPGLSPAPSLSHWLITEPKQILKGASLFYASALLGITLVVSLVIVINPKNKYGVRTPRRQQIKEISRGIVKNPLQFVAILFGLFLYLLLWLTFSSLLGFISSTETSQTASRISLVPVGGWLRFAAGIALTYSLCAVYLTGVFFSQRPSRSDAAEDNPAENISAVLVLIAFFIIFVLAAYAVGIYPSLPQQIGGGQPLQITLVTSVDELNLLLVTQDNDVHLLDRAPDNALLLILDNCTQEHEIIEIPAASIGSITYTQSP